MEIFPLLMCLAAALLAACHGCSTGREFITTFLPNFLPYKKDQKLHVILTAQGSEANVHIQVASVKFSRRLTLSAGESKQVSLPCGAELHKQYITQNSAVRISSSADISVVSTNRRPRTGDGTVVCPIQELGTDYLVYTPSGIYKELDRLMAVVNGNTQNRITISFANDVLLRGGSRIRHGKQVTITLNPYATYLVRSCQTLTGTRIKSKLPVAVLAGHQCLSLGFKCEHVYEQLPPLADLGKEYMVPVSSNYFAKSMAVIVAAEDNTEVTFHKGQKRKIRRAGGTVELPVSCKRPMVIKSNKKVLALLLSTNAPFDPLLLTLVPTSRLGTDWAVITMGGLKSIVAIMSGKEGAASVKVCWKSRCLSPRWKEFPSDKLYVWTNVAVGNQQNRVTVEGDAEMAVYVYGGKKSHSYSMTGICRKGVPPSPPPKDPCKDVKCRVKQRCMNGKCVHVTTATCYSMGDPHYSTYDGQTYDFQGSCTYIMTTVVKEAADLVPFTVTTKNDHRGSYRVSYVRTVAVTVYNQTIIIGRPKRQVQVNGELQYLPVSLLDGRVTVKRGGIYAVLRTNFGLMVKYDWNMRLIIKVPSSYYEHLGGLCGNYNGERKDDLSTAKGSSVLKMIQKWKVKDSDLFCNDDCRGRCPKCTVAQQAHYRRPNLCGILTKADGPFSACHKKVDPSVYQDNCVYDVCVNKGAKQFLCDNLKSYADACMSEDVKVNPNWRMVTKCPLPCEAGSHYEACGTACPATCMSPDKEAICKAACVEGCQCNKGFVLSGDRCVPKANCGCQYQGRYYPSQSTFWADTTCTTKCKCRNGKVKCKSVTCRKNEHCALKGGIRDCYPASYATCQGSGDPHYITLDKRRFDFQGTCTYILSQLKSGSDESLVPFQVLVQNENRGRKKTVSYTKSVSLTIFGNITVSMSRASQGQILVNGQSVNLPYDMEGGKLSLFWHGYFGIVKTSFGLVLKFNWKSHISLTLPSSYVGTTSGLCGNYNGKPGDDFLKSDGTQTTNVNAFGQSWKAGGDPGCTSDCPGGKCPECEPAQLIRYQQRRYCGIIGDKSGPFGECHSKLDFRPFQSDCVFDMCMYQGHASALCVSLSAFSTTCQEAGANVKSWRTKDFCPPSCGANSHYDMCAAPCQLTCSGLAPPEGCDESAPCGEGCVCDDGFMLSHDNCVPIAECGCQYKGQYYRNQQVFYPGTSCDTKCICSDGKTECDPEFRCSPHERCVVKGDSASCSPKSTGSCSVSGVRTVKSFDGQAYPLWGNCLFKLSEVEEKDGGMAAFSVFVKQQTNKDGQVSHSVTLQVYDMNITVETGVLWELKVDGITVGLPVSLDSGKVRANQNGINIVIETDFGLKLTYDTVAGVVLQIPSTYHNSTRGLCGNYNGDLSDDLPSPSNKSADIAAPWVVKQEEKVCDTSCGGKSCPEPDGEKEQKAKGDCDIIKAKEGPFVECHSTVSPTPDFKACVREMSTDKGGKDILCRHIQNYATACQLAGAKIKKWRSNDFCPVKCPAGSHYELCSSSCHSTCFSLQRSDPCPVCQEGCQCNDGLMSDGVQCVPVEKCGCVVDGQYYKSGQSVLLEDCSERCVCESGQFSCNSTSCKEGEKCGNKDGKIGCYSTDPCADIQCRVKEHCEVSGGEAVCVANSKASCWVFGDPHISTLDGWSYSFQGTCTYILLNTTGLDSSLPEVTVITKNEVRGDSVGSYVRSTTVDLLGHRITIPSGAQRLILVDGVKTDIPVNLEDGSISISESGVRGIIQSDIGIEVSFDWSTLVMVSINSSYYGNVAGLCGNYNGNKSDELTDARGSTAVNVTEWAKTWSVPDGDPFCYHHCTGDCPQCSEENRIRFSGSEYCGILSDKKGPFSHCHARLPVEEFVLDCVFDMCVSEDQHEALCGALSSYLAECQEAEVKILPWRHLANCSVKCPANSHYSVCGSACPPSCGPQPVVCPKICVEGCVCNEGYVRSGTECVLKEKGCGCNHDNRYYQPGEVFWADSQCEEKCACDAATQKVQCQKTKCRNGETCKVVDGVQDCYPTSFKACTARGDPHFCSFDRRKFDFQGNCVYKLASVCGDSKGLTPFEVNLENNNRRNKKVSYAKVVTVKVFGNTYTLSRDYPGKVLVDGLENVIPYSSNQSLVEVYSSQKLVFIETRFLKVSFDFKSAVRVELATIYQNATCGLCGNFNDDPNDDLMLPGGRLASNANVFGQSQWVADVAGCSHDCKECALPLIPGSKPPSYTSVCNVITAKDGPLADCLHRADSEEYLNDCIFDMRLNDGIQEAACDIIGDYVEECQEKGGIVKAWRTEKICKMKCPANSRYSLKAPGCPKTCSPRRKRCKIPDSEGCVCNPGYVLKKNRCVPESVCGLCQFKNQSFASGQKFYADKRCKRSCVCRRGRLRCKNKSCKPWQQCKVFKGVRGCYIKKLFKKRGQKG